jgi:hypothetical protein
LPNLEILHNYTAGEAIPSGPPKIVHRVLMLDEIAVENEHAGMTKPT